MSKSQRVSRGFHRLGLALSAAMPMLAVLGNVHAEVTDSQKPFSMLCVAEKGTGFDWKADDESIWQRRFCEGMELEKHLPYDCGGLSPHLQHRFVIALHYSRVQCSTE